MHWQKLRPQTRVSGLRQKLTKAMRVVRPGFSRTCLERNTTFFWNSIFAYTVHTLIREISMIAPATQSKHRERSQWTARDIGYVLATLVLGRFVTRDLVVSKNKIFCRNPSWSYVKPVVTRGSAVLITEHLVLSECAKLSCNWESDFFPNLKHIRCEGANCRPRFGHQFTSTARSYFLVAVPD
jgi:hypothetical protein